MPLSLGELWAIYAGVFLCGLGLAVSCARLLARRGWVEPAQAAGLAYLAAAVLLMYGAVIYYGTLNILTQVRYAFPVAPAAALLALWGLRALVPRRLLPLAAALTIAAVALFNLLLLTRLVLPYAFL